MELEFVRLFLYRKENLDAHVFTLLHQLALQNDLIRTNSVTLIISRISRFSDLDLSPLLISWNLGFVSTFVARLQHESAYWETKIHHSFELFVDTLIFNTAFPLDKRRLDSGSHPQMANTRLELNN